MKSKFKINDNLTVIITPRGDELTGKMILSVLGIKPELVELNTDDVVKLVDVLCNNVSRIEYRNPAKERLHDSEGNFL
jgi:hypothetical protein